MKKNGVVYLVGAGPGDAQLITVKGLQCLKDADVIIYDRLINPSLLIHAKVDAELIYVGKSPDKHTLRQEEINALLVQKAEEGKSVVRLKGGTPFVFGRGGEEAEVLSEYGIPFEVIPGISSAIAAPAYAGIPVTHRKMASSFAVITGHEAKEKDSTQRGWNKLATCADTLVFLMGVKNLPVIVDGLLKNGRPNTEPVALIECGTIAEQRTLVGNLGNIVEIANKENLTPPAVIVVGEVVHLRKELAWFEKKPLFGKRVLITRPIRQAEGMARLVAALGGEPFLLPTIEIAPPEDFTLLDDAIKRIEEYGWIIFTSVNGVEAFFDRLKFLKKDIRALSGIQFCCIGPKTAEALQRFCLNVDYVPKEYTAAAIVEGLRYKLQKGERVLLPRSKLAPDTLTKMLSGTENRHYNEIGVSVDEVIAYRTIQPEYRIQLAKQFLVQRKVDMLTFTSSSTVTNFIDMVGISELDEWLKGTIVACIGPVTAKTAEDLGVPVHVVADEHTVEGLIAAILEYLKSEKWSTTARVNAAA